MLHLRKLLIQKMEWYEAYLREQQEIDGYSFLSRPLVQFLSHIGREPVRLTTIARQLGTSRQWTLRLANEGHALGILTLDIDPADKRALIVRFSKRGWNMVKRATRSMRQIEDDLGDRIGKANLTLLVELLGRDWGIAGSTASVKPKTYGKSARLRQTPATEVSRRSRERRTTVAGR